MFTGQEDLDILLSQTMSFITRRDLISDGKNVKEYLRSMKHSDFKLVRDLFFSVKLLEESSSEDPVFLLEKLMDKTYPENSSQKMIDCSFHYIVLKEMKKALMEVSIKENLLYHSKLEILTNFINEYFIELIEEFFVSDNKFNLNKHEIYQNLIIGNNDYAIFKTAFRTHCLIWCDANFPKRDDMSLEVISKLYDPIALDPNLIFSLIRGSANINTVSENGHIECSY